MSLNDISQCHAGTHAQRGGEAGTPVQYEVDLEKRRVVVRFGRRVSASDIARYAEQLRTHPSFRPTFSEIVDLRDAEELELQANDFIELADQIDPFSADAKRAFVAHTSVQNHAARMHKILHVQRHFEIFFSIEEAEEWISRSS